MDWFGILLIILGLGIVVFGVIYNKKHHKQFEKNHPAGGGLVEDILIFILAILPWYVLKAFFIIFGLFIVVGVLFFY